MSARKHRKCTCTLCRTGALRNTNTKRMHCGLCQWGAKWVLCVALFAVASLATMVVLFEIGVKTVGRVDAWAPWSCWCALLRSSLLQTVHIGDEMPSGFTHGRSTPPQVLYRSSSAVLSLIAIVNLARNWYKMAVVIVMCSARHNQSTAAVLTESIKQ